MLRVCLPCEEVSKARRLRGALIRSQCVCLLHNATRRYGSIKSSPRPWGVLGAPRLRDGVRYCLYVQVFTWHECLESLLLKRLAACECVCERLLHNQQWRMCACMRVSEDLAAAPARECCWHKGKATAPSPRTTISMALIVPSKQWWVSAHGLAAGKPKRGSHESWGFFFWWGGGYASSSRLATPHVNVSMYISKHELRCLCQRMQNLSICVKDLLAWGCMENYQSWCV